MLLFNGMFQMWSHACKTCKTGSARVNLRNTEGISLNCVVFFLIDNKFYQKKYYGMVSVSAVLRPGLATKAPLNVAPIQRDSIWPPQALFHHV